MDGQADAAGSDPPCSEFIGRNPSGSGSTGIDPSGSNPSC